MINRFCAPQPGTSGILHRDAHNLALFIGAQTPTSTERLFVQLSELAIADESGPVLRRWFEEGLSEHGGLEPA